MKKAAKKAGVEKRRVVFASWVPSSSEHLDRSSLCALSLDTPLYNSMTTGCDILWSGVPLISTPGEKMVARLAASLLIALGTPQLVVRGDDDLINVSLALLHQPASLHAATQATREGRVKGHLFDMQRRVGHLVRVLRASWDMFSAGVWPKSHLSISEE
eukprot:CAMPEP_0175942386 /NCGR_PEP_ID=MMETSP0108-20121206/24916_1 /TAXON_ID=195067 ORGANISM="Goniomonas pacifica, Strain CCMP1869" /NCGR_SAMPLE_ID=MMETSP0108 /ASSEMBLY_ACC=CAM_ASM_000204 /LENGTH=158 /DNA_ID=CAMNT_0017267129 /DNA_START=17 /DNA_END=493 /DNA_ORIENTATION=-